MEKRFIGSGKGEISFQDVLIIMMGCDSHTGLRNDWNVVATFLKLTPPIIDDIDRENPKKQPLSLMQSVLIKWKSKYPTEATLETLMAALRAASYDEIVEKLKEKLCVDSEIEIGSGDTVAFSSAGPSGKDFVDGNDQILRYVDPAKVIPVKVVPPSEPMNFEDFYKLPPGFKGYALIINILKFQFNHDRSDAAVDTHNLTYLFDQLGYTVMPISRDAGELTEVELADILHAFKKKCYSNKVSSFIVFLGSHGREAQLQLSNRKCIDIYNKIIYNLCYNYPGEENLWWSKIPKMFFVQACREIPTDATNQKIDNCIVSFSCMPGKLSYRHPDNFGSYYVSCLTKVFMENAHRMDLTTMLNKVKDFVWEETQGLKERQQPVWYPLGEFKDLYFNLTPR